MNTNPIKITAGLTATLGQLRKDTPAAIEALKACWPQLSGGHGVLMPSITALKWVIWDYGMPGAPPFVPTACTDGYSVWINPTFFVGLTKSERIFLIAHEVFHPLLNHLTRLAGHRKNLVNIAADYEINNLLRNYMAGQTSPVGQMKWIEGGISDNDEHQFKGLAAEVISVKLAAMTPEPQQDDSGEGKDDSGEGKGEGEGDGESGEGEGQGDGDGDGNGDGNGDGKGKSNGKGKGRGDSDGQQSEEDAFKAAQQAASGKRSAGEFITAKPGTPEQRKLREKWTQIAAQTANAARLAGKNAGAWVEMIESTLAAPVDLSAILDRYLAEYTMSDEGYRVHRPTLNDHGYCIPDSYTESHGTLVFVKDTSGSVSTNEAEAVLACIESAFERLNARRFVVLDVDTDIASVQELDAGDKISREFKGRGGTDFRPPFKWVDSNADDCRVLLYFTDGEGPFPAAAPSYPVIWINFNKHAVRYPWGEVIDISGFIH